MNLLTGMRVSGELKGAYALLSLEYTFVNRGTGPVSPRYFLPLPQGAVISGLRAAADGRVIQGEIRALSDPALTESGAQLIQLEPWLCCLEWPGLDAGARCTLAAEVTLRLLPAGDRLRLFLPLGLESAPPSQAANFPVEVSLMAEPSLSWLEAPGLSPQLIRHESYTEIVCHARAGQDLVLDLGLAPAPLCFLSQSLGEGLGLFRVCARDIPAPEPERVLLLLDLTGAPSRAELRAVRELCCRVLGQLPAGTPVQVWSTAPEQPALLPDYLPAGEALCDRVLGLLSGLDSRGGSLPALLGRLSGLSGPPPLCILLSSGRPAEAGGPDIPPLRFPVHLFTVGDLAQTDFTLRWQLAERGRHLHFYAADLTPERAAEALARLPGTDAPASAMPEDGLVREVLPLPGPAFETEGYQDLLVRYTGPPPRVFGIWREGRRCGSCTVPPGPVYGRLPVLGHIYAHAKTCRLTHLLGQTSPCSIRAIKAQLTELGLRYGIVNSEMVLAFPGLDGRPEAMPVYLRGRAAAGPEGLAGRPSAFEEGAGLTGVDREQALRLCRSVLLDSLRGDGAIASPGCVGTENRAVQTAYGLLALPRCMDGHPDLDRLCEDAEEFLRAHPPADETVRQLLDAAKSPTALRSAAERLLPPAAELAAKLRQPAASAEAVPAAAGLILRLKM